jgi:DNA-binding NarL/FixJ family response regulator
MAIRLDLTQQTVHQYIRAIYRHYCVHSRAELLAHWIRVRPEDIDRWQSDFRESRVG